jgi:hypothetical protein
MILRAALSFAQEAPSEKAYVTGGFFVDVKRFSGSPTDATLDGNAPGGAIAVGTDIGSRWGLQLGFDMTGFSSTERPRTVTFQKETITLTSIVENRVVSVATLLRFRGAPHGRFRLGYLGGLSFIRLDRRFHTIAPGGTPPALIPKPDQSVDYSAAPTVGLDARLQISSHFSVIPGIYACVFRLTDISGLLVRPRIGVRWTF